MDANIDAYIEATYQKIRRLKESEKGEVWLASEKSGRLVILKRIALTGLPYRALKENDYALCPHIFHAWEDEGETIVVEEYVQGESLLDRLGRKAYLTEQEAQNILLQLCDGLAPIHAQGIVHRDIKHSNLILQNGGIIRLIDFDAARTVKENLNEDTRFLGTKGYAPPEQYGYGQTDERSDIFSLGVTLQKSLSKDYHGYLTKILSKCTSLDPAHRYQSVQELKRTVLWHGRWSKWGRTATAAAVIISVGALGIFGVTGKALTPPNAPMTETTGTVKVESPAPSGGVATENVVVPATQEPSPSVSQPESPSAPTAVEVAPAASATAEELPSAASYHDNYRPPKVAPAEIANIESIDAFLAQFKDDPEKLAYWKQRSDVLGLSPNASETEKRKAEQEQLDIMQRGELGLRVDTFIEQLPDTLTQEERNRAIDEFTAEQRKILGIKHWP